MARLSRTRRARAARLNRRRSARIAFGPEALESRALLTAAPYHDVWVNGAWLDAGTLGPASLTAGEQVTDGVVTKTYGADAFSSIQAGVAVVAGGGEVHVDPGVYGENIDVAKNMSIEAVGAATLQSSSTAAALTVESGYSVFVVGLAIANSPIGVRVDGGSATISGATISNNTFGIYVNGGTAAINGSHVFANMTGIRFFDSATGSVAGNNFAGGMSPRNGVDLLLSASVGTVTIGPGNAFAGAAYIDNETNHSIDATAANSFDGANLTDLDPGTTSGLAGLYAVENRVTDGLDQSGAGLVRLKSGDVFLAQSSETTRNGSLQRAVNLAGTGNIIYVQAGTYVTDANFIDAAGLVSELNIDKPLSLVGPNADFDPHAGTTPIHPQAIILPGTSNPNPADSTAVSVIGVRASHVTIRGLTIDGDNPALAADPRTIVYNGVPIDAFDGISCYAGVGSLTIDHNVVRNTTYTGIDLENGSTAANAANSVAYNLIKNIGGAGAGFGTGVFLSNNFYAAVTNNVIDTALVGIQTQGFSAANPAGPGTAQISGNTIAAVGSGIWYNDFSAAASPFAVSDNMITAIEDSASLGRWVGVLISSQLAGAGATFQNNAIDGSATAANPSQTSSGYQVWNAPGSGAPIITTGSVAGVQFGVWVNSFEGDSDNAGATQAAINGANITASRIGVYIEDSPQNAAHPAVSATIDGGTIRTTSSSAGVGVKISGASASATINGVAIDDPLYGIEASAGRAVVTDSLIENNGTGIFAHGGGSVSVSSNSILGNTTGIEIADATLGSATNNIVTGGQLGIRIDANAIEVGPIGGGNLVGNSIAGNTVAGLRNDSSLAIDAIGNWWGSADGPNSSLNTYHANNPSADAVVGVPLTIAAWLTDGTDTAPATYGFQPMPLDAHAPSLSGQTDQAAIEGAVQTIDFGSFSDPDNAGGGPWHVIVNWGANSTSDSFNALSAGNLGAILHTFAHEGHYTVTVSVIEQAGTSGSAAFDVNVADAAPVVNATNGSVSAAENASAHNTGNYGDYDDAVSVSGTGVTDNHDGTWSWSGTGDEDHPYDVTVTATNADGLQASTTFHVSFNDVAPTVTADHDVVSATENSTAHNVGTYGDYDDVVSVAGNGVTDNHDGTWSWSGTGDEEHPYDVTVTATNAHGLQSSTTFHVSFSDNTPTIAADHDSVNAPENSAAHNTGTYGDYDDVVSVAGTGVTDNHDGTWSWSGNGDEEHPYDVTVTATNADGSQANTTFHVSFDDVAPTVAAVHDSVNAAENSAAHNSGTYGDYDDFVSVSGAGVTDNHDGTWSWSGTGDEEHPYDLTVTATNAHGSQTSTTFHVSFTDIAPTIAAEHDAVSAVENATAHNSGTYGDYDDFVSVSGAGVTDNHDGTWSWSGAGDEDHPYDVTVTATNAHGSQSSTTFHVSFNDVLPTVATDHGAVSAAENSAAHNTGTCGDYDDAVSVSGTGVTDNHDGTWSWSGTGDEDHPYDVTVTAINGDGLEASTTFHVSFNDVAPTVAAEHDTVSAVENATAHNSGTYGDYDDVVSVSGAGVTDNHDGKWSWSGTGDEDHPYDVTVTATNADGSQSCTTFHVSFNDVPPTVAAEHDTVSAAENASAHNTGTYGDYDDVVSVSCAGVTDNHDGTWSWSGTGDEDHPYDVTVTATNAHGSQSSTTFHVSFNDVAPTVTADHDVVSATENSTAHNTGTYGDYDDVVSIAGAGVTDNHDGTWSWSGSGDDDHPYDVTVTATNANGLQSSTTFHVSFTDIAPTIAAVHDAISAAENASAHNTGTYGDYDDVVSVSGTGVTDNHDGTWSWSGTGDEEHPYDVTVTATNAHGSQASTTFHVSFNDVAPTVAADHDAVIATENSTAHNTGTYGDHDDVVSVAGAGVTDNHDGTWSWSGTGDEDHPYDVTVTATNAHGSQSSTTFHVSFTDAPLTGSSTAAADGTEGAADSSVLSAATFTDANPGDHAGDFTAAVHWGNNNSSPGVVSYSGGVYTVSAAHTYFQEGTFNITIDVADVGGSTATITGMAAVADPPIDATGGFLVAAGIQTDSGMTTVATFTDPGGPEDPNADYSATIDWGDSSAATPGTISYDSQNAMFVVQGSHTYSSPNPGTYPILVTIHHEATTAQIVSSTAHVASLSIDLSADPTPVNEAAPLTLTLGAVNDPHPLEQSQITGYDIDWGDGSPQESYSFSGAWSPGMIAKTHTYADGPANWMIHVSLHDASGLHPNVGSLPISVLNVAPIVNVAGDLAVNQNSLFTKTGSFADPGADGWVGQVNFGDGSGWQPLPLAADKTFTLSHSYSSAVGSPYLVSVQVADHNGAGPDALSGAGTFHVTVNPPPTFQVDSFTGSSSGFDVTFDRPIDPSRLNLYQGASDELGPADVTLIAQHSNSPVRGSLIWDAATNTAHFVATGGLLPSDTYSVDLASRVDGWTDSNGSPLDGLATGIAGSGDYRNTFVVATPAFPVLSLPDFARGPGQSLDVNADGTARTPGLPVHLSNAAGLRSLSFEIDFDPSLLNLTGAISASGLPADWSVTAQRTNSGGGGQLVVSASGTTALAAGPRDIVDLLGDIPSGASYRAAQLLKPINVQLNSGAIGVVVDEAVEKIAYFGDATGDSTLSGLDASFISRNIVSLDDGFSAFPLTDPRIIADVTGNGTLSGLDASFVANASVGNSQPTIPAVPSHVTPAMSGLDPTVAIPLGVSAEPGGTVTLPVTVSEVNGMQAIDLTFSYDPAAFSVSPTDLSLSGAVAAEGWAAALNLSTPGLIRLSLYGTRPIVASGADTLLGVTFHVSPTAADGEYPISVVTTPSTASRLNEGLFALSTSNGSVVVATGFEVVNTNDDGPGSLRQAIVSANALGGTTHTIRFTLPTGRQTIQPLMPLPATSVSVVIQLDASQDVTIIGNIDGTGSLVVNAGSNLTANRIVQSALVIGGTESSFGTVTISASDAAGNPLAVAAPAVSVESSIKIDLIATNSPPVTKSPARHPASICDAMASAAPNGSVVADGFEPDSVSISAVAPRAEALANKAALDAAFAQADFNPGIDDGLLNLLAGSTRRRHRGTHAVAAPTDEATATEPSKTSALLD